jgi:hypothetical protein
LVTESIRPVVPKIAAIRILVCFLSPRGYVYGSKNLEYFENRR